MLSTTERVEVNKNVAKKLKKLIVAPKLELISVSKRKVEAKIFVDKFRDLRFHGYSETEIAKMLLGNKANSEDLRKKYNKMLKLLKKFETEE